MKKIQVLLAMLAIVAASVGVYASEFSFTEKFYEDDARPGHCDVQIASNPCEMTGLIPCESSNSLHVYVSIDDEGCEPVLRP